MVMPWITFSMTTMKRPGRYSKDLAERKGCERTSE